MNQVDILSSIAYYIYTHYIRVAVVLLYGYCFTNVFFFFFGYIITYRVNFFPSQSSDILEGFSVVLILFCFAIDIG